MPDPRTVKEDRERPGTGPCGGGSCLMHGVPETRMVGSNRETGQWRWLVRPYARNAPLSEIDVEVPGSRRWFPTLVERPNGVVTQLFWEQNAPWDDQRYGFRSNDVEWSADEWDTIQTLSDDNVIRAMDWTLALTLYYSLLQWTCRCGGGRQATVQPSVISPASLAGRCDTWATYFVEQNEQRLRDRIYRLRPDLRSVKLPDGRVVQGLIDPNDRVFRAPPCTSTFAVVSQAFMASVLAFAPTSLLFEVVQKLVRLPSDLSEMREAVRRGSLMSQVAEFAQIGPGEAPPPLQDRAGGVLTTSPSPTPPAGAILPLLIALGAAAMLLA